MSEIKVDTVKGRDGKVLLGDSGDTISVPSGATLTTTDATFNTGAVTATIESKTNKISPASGTAFTFGDSGDTFTIPSGVTLANSGTASGFGAGPVLIQSQTASSSSSVAFTSGIDSTYDEYMFVCTDIHANSDNKDFGFQANVDGQTGFNEVITSTFWTATVNSGGGAGAVVFDAPNHQAQGTALSKLIRAMGNAATESGVVILHLFAPSSTTYVKHFYARAHNAQFEGYVQSYNVAGYFNVTGAIDEIEFKMTSGTFNGTIKLYGVS